jgi:hypothetical protein
MEQKAAGFRKRNRSRPATSLEERLLKFAENARTAAQQATSGREKDELHQKARQAEVMANAARPLRE